MFSRSRNPLDLVLKPCDFISSSYDEKNLFIRFPRSRTRVPGTRHAAPTRWNAVRFSYSATARATARITETSGTSATMGRCATACSAPTAASPLLQDPSVTAPKAIRPTRTCAWMRTSAKPTSSAPSSAPIQSDRIRAAAPADTSRTDPNVLL